ncbi:hypothetical Protein YC6258_05622 [Gynuella sunshinyii YC6258]|uniref:Uncharacterized protein n=1 Tax=Gynuella sunshinyii YC6258 TaxID=1445510 RepID=A0A0C5VED0_9GAMM|nr:hypothetical Protein YC6258_05622 [Gynuella sunshinyii YC6258]
MFRLFWKVLRLSGDEQVNRVTWFCDEMLRAGGYNVFSSVH